MSRASTGLTICCALLLVSCGSSTTDNNADPNVAPNNDNVSANNGGTNATPNNDNAANVQPFTKGWRVELTGVDDLGLPGNVGGPLVLVSATPGGSSIAGTAGAAGASLLISFVDRIGTGDWTSEDLNLSFTVEPRFRCTSTQISFTITSEDPWAGTFEGDVTCADQPDMAESAAGTISGEIKG